MKNLIIIITIIFMSACGIHKNEANGTKSYKLKRYKPLEKFNGDTLAFVQQSILDRKQYYIGKELGVLLKDFPIKVIRFSYSPAPVNIFKVYDTGLWTNGYEEENEKTSRGKDPITLVIRWNPPLDANALDSLPKRKYNAEWTPEVEEYLSKQIVGNIVKTDYKLKK